MLLATRPSLFGPSSVAAHCPLSPQGPCGDGLSHALFFLFSQGFPLPPSCPLKRLGSDHLDVWALPRGQGGSEGGQLLPAPTLSPGPLCCFCAKIKVSQSLPVLFCVLPPTPHHPPCPCPTPPQRIEMSAQDMGPIYVNPACPCVALVSLQPGPARVPLVARPRPVANFSSTIGLLPPPGVLPLSTRGASSNWGGSQTCPLCGRDVEPPQPSLSSLDLLSVP